MQVKAEHKTMLPVIKAHVLPTGTVALVPGGTVCVCEEDVEDRQMAGQKNSQKGLQPRARRLLRANAAASSEALITHS